MTEKYASHLTSLIVYVKTVLTEWMYILRAINANSGLNIFLSVHVKIGEANITI